MHVLDRALHRHEFLTVDNRPELSFVLPPLQPSGQHFPLILRRRIADAHPDQEIGGTIVSAGRTVQQQSGTKNPVKVLKVGIGVDRTDPAQMRPGMRFQGTVELARARGVVLVPRAAVFISGSGPVAYRRGLFSVSAVPLRIGRQNDKVVEVVSGLAPADRVLVEQPEDKNGDAKS